MDALRDALHQCNTGNHDLIEIARTTDLRDDVDNVIMWCRICGAVVGDIECDGRVQAGGNFKMMGPKALKLVQLYYD